MVIRALDDPTLCAQSVVVERPLGLDGGVRVGSGIGPVDSPPMGSY